MGGGAVPPPPMTANAPMGAQGARGPNQGLYANGGRGGGNMFGAGDPTCSTLSWLAECPVAAR